MNIAGGHFMYLVRRANYEDAETIADIHFKTWKSTYTELIDEKDITNMTYENRKILWETILRMPRKEQCIFVIEVNNDVVGFIFGGPERTDNENYDSAIYDIYIMDGFQKQGLGAKLLKAFAKEMKKLGNKSMLVWVLTQNPSSRFYERYDAQLAGEVATTIGEGSYEETAYGWKDIDKLISSL